MDAQSKGYSVSKDSVPLLQSEAITQWDVSISSAETKAPVSRYSPLPAPTRKAVSELLDLLVSSSSLQIQAWSPNISWWALIRGDKLHLTGCSLCVCVQREVEVGVMMWGKKEERGPGESVTKLGLFFANFSICWEASLHPPVSVLNLCPWNSPSLPSLTWASLLTSFTGTLG